MVIGLMHSSTLTCITDCFHTRSTKAQGLHFYFVCEMNIFFPLVWKRKKEKKKDGNQKENNVSLKTWKKKKQGPTEI